MVYLHVTVVPTARAGNAWPHNAQLYHYFMPISCHLFPQCKALLTMSHDSCKQR